MVRTYGELYLELKKELRAAGVESAELEGRELTAAAAGKDRREFERDRAKYASDAVAERAHELVQRRIKGEPLGYILGEWDFMGLTFKLSPAVLIPRMDTEILAERAIALARETGAKRMLDVCCGSGCIGISVAKYIAGLQVWMTDISEEALAVARQNAREHLVLGRVNCVRQDATQPAPRMFKDFDLLCCNPPYIKTADIDRLDVTVREHEPRIALDGGADGLELYRAIIPNCAAMLKKGGYLLFEVGEGQAKDVAELLRKNDFAVTEIIPDTAEIDRVVVARNEM